MQDYTAPLTPGGMYHVYGRANGTERIFRSKDNYEFFMKKYEAYVGSFVDTYCYCLIPNHFHLVIAIKDQDVIEHLWRKPKANCRENEHHKFLSKQFSNFLNCYAKAFNKQQGRKGNLFIRPFKRKRITDERYLRNVIQYIHHNPVEAGLADSLAGWQYSSYHQLINEENKLLNRKKVFELYEGQENFVFAHQSIVTGPELSRDR